jgi:hypothetical protein
MPLTYTGRMPGAAGVGGGYNPAYGGIPNVPSPTGTASSTIGGNIGNLGGLYNLSTGTGTASGAGVIAGLNAEIPGVTGSIATARGGIDELLSGQVPQDVITQLQQQSAEIGAGRGQGPGAPSTNAQYLRSLGLTSLGMKAQGQQELDALMGSVPRAPAFDPSSMLVNPAEAQQWAYLSEVLKNAPNPTAAADANLAALRAGTGIGGEPSFGGFGSRQPIGGPAFSGPGLTAPSEGAFPVFGGTGDPGRYADPTNPTADAYARWRALTSSYPAATAPADGGGGDYYDSEPYFDPNE